MIQPNDFMIETPILGKSCGDAQVLQDVDLNISRHSILGFLGPPRGGKTALKKVLLILIQQTTDRGLIYSLLPTIGSVGLIISHSLSCLAFILVVLFRFEKTEF